MADIWHYTREGKQMDPVSGAELRQLAAEGLLKPTDFVWNESLPAWVRAATQNFFAEKEMIAATPASEQRQQLEDARRPTRRRLIERQDEDEYDDQPRRRRRRPPVETGMNPGLKVGLIIGGSFLGLVLLVVVIVAFKITQRGNQQARFRRPFNNPPPFIINQQPFNNPNQGVNNVPPDDRPPKARDQANLKPPPVFQGPIDIAPGGFEFKGELNNNDSSDNWSGFPCKVFAIKMEAGKTYSIQLRRRNVRNQFLDFDPYLRIQDKDFTELAHDDDSGGDQDSLIIFQPVLTDEYRVIASSFNGAPGNFTLQIMEN